MSDQSTGQTTPAEEMRVAATRLREGGPLLAREATEPLANWLEASAKHAAKVSDPRNQEIIADQHALKVARVINGTAK